MTDKPNTPPVAPVAAPPPAADANGQLIVALAIVIVLGLLGGGLVIAGVLDKTSWAALAGIIGTIAGALAQALTAPSGIGNVIRSAKVQSTPPDTTPP